MYMSVLKYITKKIRAEALILLCENYNLLGCSFLHAMRSIVFPIVVVDPYGLSRSVCFSSFSHWYTSGTNVWDHDDPINYFVRIVKFLNLTTINCERCSIVDNVHCVLLRGEGV